MIGILALTAVLAPLAGGAVAWWASARAAQWIAAVSIALASVSSLAAGMSVWRDGPQSAFNGVVAIDALSAYVLLTVAVVALLALLASPGHLRHGISSGELRPHDPARYYALLLGFVASLMAAPILDSLGLLWVAIEASTVVAALLVGFTRTPTAIEAAWKYLILGSVGVAFALLGTLLAYASSVPILGETSDALNWTRLVAVAPSLDPALLRLAFLFALVGYGTKVGLAPFHTWLPDAHSQAPSPISAILSGVSLNVALYALIRFHLVAVGGLGEGFSGTLLVVFGLISLAVALPFIVAQGDLKRLLAYSSIEHMGLLAVAIGVGGRVALLGASLHLLTHALTKSTLFLAAGRLVERYGSRRLGRLRGTFAGAPVAGIALVLAIVLIGGLPPSGVFAAEIAILFGGAASGFGPAIALAAVLLALAFAGFAFHGVRLAWGDAPDAVASEARESRLDVLLFGVPLTVVVVLGIWTPQPLQVVLDQVVAVLGGGRG